MNHSGLATAAVALSTPWLLGAQTAFDPSYTLHFEEGAGAYPGTSASLICELDALGDIEILGWTLGVCHDTDDLDPTAAVSGATTATVNRGGPPDFEQINVVPNGSPLLMPGLDPGVNQGVVISFLGDVALPFESDLELLEIRYDVIGSPGSTTLDYCETTPRGLAGAVAIILACTCAIPIAPATTPGTIDIYSPFRRGDVNDDGAVEISDAVNLVEYLFQDGPIPPCLEAGDGNDDGRIDLADAIYVLASLLGGPAPPRPFVDCGIDDSSAPIGCLTFGSCP